MRTALHPIQVFLGPSLDKETASQILEAEYLPPARMGDVYHILASGVKIIVLIDGIFHSVASVWQRELLEAISNQILVIGASSMGALRAAELHPFGMIGCGTIFRWYRDGFIDGDDEVALMHATEEGGYKGFSEPLVNIRYSFQKAVQEEILSEGEANELIRYAKSLCFSERSYSSLLEQPLVQKWLPEKKEKFSQFLSQDSHNRKRQDAIEALEYCAKLVKEGYAPIRYPLAPDQDRYHKWVVYKNRGFLTEENTFVRSERVWKKIRQEKQRTLPPLIRQVSKSFFLIQWTQHHQLKCPQEYISKFRQRWENNYKIKDVPRWLSLNGLTEHELEREIEKRALLEWIIDKTPRHFNLDFKPYIQFLEQWMDIVNPKENRDIAERSRILTRLSETCFIADWARERGIVCPQEEAARWGKKWRRFFHQRNSEKEGQAFVKLGQEFTSLLMELALCNWIFKKGPLFFGYSTWSTEVACMKEWQVTGQIAFMLKNQNITE